MDALFKVSRTDFRDPRSHLDDFDQSFTLFQLMPSILVGVIDIFGKMKVVGPRASFSDRGLSH